MLSSTIVGPVRPTCRFVFPFKPGLDSASGAYTSASNPEAVSQKTIKPGEQFTVTASVANTFLDGGRIALLLDGKPVAFKWAWARAGRKESLEFPLTLEQSGRHEVTVGRQKISVTVEP